MSQPNRKIVSLESRAVAELNNVQRTKDASSHRPARKALNRVLWSVQILLALLFLFSGVVKLMLPPDQLKGPVELSVPFLRFIGVCEVLGGFGLILPGLFKLYPMLTPLAALGLLVIMTGATVTSFVGGQVVPAVITIVIAALLIFAGYNRWKVSPHRNRRAE